MRQVSWRENEVALVVDGGPVPPGMFYFSTQVFPNPYGECPRLTPELPCRQKEEIRI
jgi:hypothetical protein